MRYRLEWIAVIVLVALLGGGWTYLSKEDGPTTISVPAAQAPFVGNLAPDFTLDTLEGGTVSLSEFTQGEGKPVVINFWATWCPPCRIEMPFFQRADERYGDRVAILGINQAESAETIRDYVETNGLSYPMLIDFDMKVNNRYAVQNLPTTLFIDKNGMVKEILIGTISQAVLDDRIEGLLEE